MNKIIALLLLIAVVITGLASYRLFRLTDYNLSALLTIASYASIVLSIYALSIQKRKIALK